MWVSATWQFKYGDQDNLGFIAKVMFSLEKKLKGSEGVSQTDVRGKKYLAEDLNSTEVFKLELTWSV